MSTNTLKPVPFLGHGLYLPEAASGQQWYGRG